MCSTLCVPVVFLGAVDMIGKKDACVKAAYPMTGPESAYHLMKVGMTSAEAQSLQFAPNDKPQSGRFQAFLFISRAQAHSKSSGLEQSDVS